MKNIFVDTNVIIDLLGNRKPYSKFAIELFKNAETKKVNLYTSSHAFATTYYVLKKITEDQKLRKILISLLDYIQIIPIDFSLLKRGLISPIKDFEDALQIMAAGSVSQMDYIVTRNIKDFKESIIPVYPPDAIINIL